MVSRLFIMAVFQRVVTQAKSWVIACNGVFSLWASSTFEVQHVA